MAQIEVVTDLEGRWGEIGPLLRGLHEHHVPLLGKPLLVDWEEPQRRHLVSRAASEDDRVLLARIDGRAVGFANGEVRRDPAVMRETFGSIENVYVRPEARGTGVASALVRALEGWFRGRGAREAQLSVVAANARAIEVWSALGFEPLSHRLRKSLG